MKKTTSMACNLGKLAALSCIIFSWFLFLSPIKGTEVFFQGQDKLAHLMVYSALLLINGTFFKLDAKLIALVLFLQGVMIEFIQPYVGRSFEWGDMLANAA